MLVPQWELLDAQLKTVEARIAVGMWQLSFMVQQFPEGSAERIGAIMGGIFTGGFRVALLGLYAAALVVFTMWSASAAGARGCELR